VVPPRNILDYSNFAAQIGFDVNLPKSVRGGKRCWQPRSEFSGAEFSQAANISPLLEFLPLCILKTPLYQ